MLFSLEGKVHRLSVDHPDGALSVLTGQKTSFIIVVDETLSSSTTLTEVHSVS